MRNLARPLLRLLGRDDRGAIGVLIAVLIGGGVLLGMGALVIDAGQIYQNHSELQNGADAAAMGAARQCALGTCTTASATSTSLTYADSNASALTQHTAGVTTVCGSSGLGSCSSVVGTGLTSCPPDPANGVNFVDVLASTKLANGSTLLPPVFGRTLAGSSTYDGTNVKACAQAEWGYAEQSDSLALTISLCQWQDLTSSGGSGFNTLVPVFIKGAKVKPCSGPAGQNIPGGFDWLQQTSSTSCTAKIDLTTDTTVTNTGNNVSSACKDALVADVSAYVAGHPVTLFLPIFGCPSPPVTGCPVTGTGANATYYIIGLAGFVITGYTNIPGLHPDAGTNSACTGNTPCIEGYFTPGIDPVADYLNPTTSFGFSAKAIKLSG
ncbi:MAG TPA: pilus assembly protein TadG-related protein [Streptosporangiaceae bacterium]|jgi:Flp pilus assembly protein TadG